MFDHTSTSRRHLARSNLLRVSSVATRLVLIVVFVAVQAALARAAHAEERRNSGGTFTDSRDGKTYKTVVIADRIWMAENLSYDAAKGSYCYDDDVKNCSTYGRLYTFEAARRAVPQGWHLPSKDEFERLLAELGGPGPAYAKLVDGGSSQFNVLFAGSHNASGGPQSPEGFYAGLGLDTSFWSSSGNSLLGDFFTGEANQLTVSRIRQEARIYGSLRSYGFSIRCVKD